ncbi:MAG: triose-phosphate isomerase [Propionibacteriaceae bacterium]|jgi:triosephosphate isomerase|nr:triose-phosphate isomerase [Propionibacteriaceae bacterium]
MPRKPLIAGNWKMNVNHIEAVGLVQKLAWALDDFKYNPAKAECLVIPPFVDLRSVQTLIEADKMPLTWGAQDVSEHENGAYTGDISAEMLLKLGCSYVIIGHSERRQYHHESDFVVNEKARNALAKGLTPIICVGEGLEVRRAGEQVQFTLEQVAAALEDRIPEQVAKVVIAYEPIWAIGTGEVATPEDAQEVCGAIRGKLAELYGDEVAEQVRVLYGGSVKASTIVALMVKPDIDGVLVGGASLNPDEFAFIVRFYEVSQLSQTSNQDERPGDDRPRFVGRRRANKASKGE